jgi:Kef-type K+ transport system membrane component KefB
MANMTIGFIVANRVADSEPIAVMEGIEEVVFAIFFVFSGMHFDAGIMRTAGILALLIVATRFTGKYVGTRIGATISHAPAVIKKYLGLALLPKAGVTLGLALLAQRTFPIMGNLIFNGVLASVIINELVAPPLTKYAITKSGEAEGAVESTPEAQ